MLTLTHPDEELTELLPLSPVTWSVLFPVARMLLLFVPPAAMTGTGWIPAVFPATPANPPAVIFTMSCILFRLSSDFCCICHAVL